MKSLIVKQAEKFLREQKNHKRWLAVFLCLAVVVATGTTAALKYKGIAVTTDNEEMHVHTDECYEEQKVLICDLEEGEGSEGSGHVHTDACYAITEGGTKLACGKEEHTHGDSCYTTTEGTTELTCGMEENLAEEGGHVHDGSCYTTSGGGRELTCGLEEHTHGDGCYTTTEGTKELICGLEEGEGSGESGHVHDDSCYEIKKVLICEEKTEENTEEEPEEDAEEEPEEDAEEEPEEEEYTSGTLSARGDDYEVIVSYDEEAKIPEDAELKVEEIEAGSDAYQECYDQMLEALPEGWDEEEQEIAFARFFDITILVDGEEIEPETGATVQIKYDDAVVEEEKEQGGFAVHFPRSGGTEILDAEISGGKDFTFDQSSFSVTGTGFKVARAPQKGDLLYRGNDYNVTVSYDKGSNVSRDCELIVTEIVDDGGNEADNKSYRKYLNNSEGAIKEKTNYKDKELEVSGRVLALSIEKDGKPIKTGEVEVSIEFTSPMVAKNAGIAAMVLDAGESGDILSEEEVEQGKEITKFSGRMSFSASENTVTAVLAEEGDGDGGSSTPGDSTSTGTTGLHEFKEEWLQYPKDPAVNNGWQIVSGGYEGNSESNKPTRNEDVRVQKNVIPTDTENEFLVYLSIDVKTTLSRQIDKKSFGALVKNNTVGVDTPVNPSEVVAVDIGTAGDKTAFHVTFKDPKGNSIDGFTDVIVGWGKSVGEGANGTNITLAYKINDKYYVIGTLEKGNKEQEIQFTETVYDMIMSQRKEESILERVTDSMGPYITCEEILGGDYKSKPTPGDTIYWEPLVNPKCATDPENIENITDGTYWNLNAAQLVYRVTLDVEALKKSCAEHMDDDVCATPVNSKATLTYKEGGSIVFPEPQVRGLLYDISLKKVDADTVNMLPGAIFAIKKSGGDYVLNSDGKPLEVTSDADGIVRFNNLPYGTYDLVEIEAPEGYQSVGDDGRTLQQSVTVCYTTDRLAESRSLEQDVNPYQANMIYKGGASSDVTQTGNDIVVTNEKIPPIKLVKVWDDDNNIRGLRPDSVTYNIKYKVGNEFEDVPAVTKDGKVIISEGGLVTLEPTAGGEGSVSNQWELLVDNLPESAEYQVTEILPDDSSYQIKIPEGATDSNKDKAVCTSETVKIYGKDKKINVYTITNELKKTEIQLVKIEEGKPGILLSGAMFDIWVKTKDLYKDEDHIQSPWGEKDPEAINWKKTTGEDGIIFDGKLPYGEYWLVETKAPDNYIEKDHPYILTVGHSGVTISYNTNNQVEEGVVISKEGDKNIVKIPNKTAERNVEIWKKETGTGNKTDSGFEGATLLKGAEFSVYYTDSLEGELTWPEDVSSIVTWKSGENGALFDENNEVIDALNIGRYMLRETKAPDGYNKPIDDIVITVNSEKITLDNYGSVIKDEESGVFKIYIENSAGLMLPETGGPGVAVYTLGGFALIAAALMYGFSMRRKRGEGGYVR